MSQSMMMIWSVFFGYDINDNNPEIYQIILHIEEGSPCCANYPLKRSGKDNSDKLEAATIENVPTFFIWIAS